MITRNATEPGGENSDRSGVDDPLARAARYPQLRFMGSKHRLLPWITQELTRLSFDTALDAFSGSGCVSYALKGLGKQVTSNDFLLFTHYLAKGTVQNSGTRLDEATVAKLLTEPRRAARGDFVQRTFKGIFYKPKDLAFLDQLWGHLPHLESPLQRALVICALVRACVKKQPRGVFTIGGNLDRYDDGRRDLRISLEQHFLESVDIFNAVVFSNGRRNRAIRGDVFDVTGDFDLVYMDPPYVPRSDDNCYIKRYHFLEGLASYWQEEGTEIMTETKVRKIPKRFTPFSYRRTALEAFEQLFEKFRDSILVLSYSSNGYPDLPVLKKAMTQFKSKVTVHEQSHRYHFGTHGKVSSARTSVAEYLIVGE